MGLCPHKEKRPELSPLGEDTEIRALAKNQVCCHPALRLPSLLNCEKELCRLSRPAHGTVTAAHA